RLRGGALPRRRPRLPLRRPVRVPRGVGPGRVGSGAGLVRPPPGLTTLRGRSPRIGCAARDAAHCAWRGFRGDTSPREAALVAPGGADLAARGRGAGPVDEVRWALRWQGWADWSLSLPTLILAAAAVILDVATAWARVTPGSLGRIEVSAALPLALL